MIEQFERTGFRVDREGAERASGAAVEIADLVDGVKIFAVGVDGQERRIDRFRRYPDGSELAFFGIEAVAVNSFASGF